MALVAGPGSLGRLDHVARTLLVGLLDEPMPVALVCPRQHLPQDLPSPPISIFAYPELRWPILRTRIVHDLAAQLAAARVGALHALDIDALTLTRQLALHMDVHAVAGFYSLLPAQRLAECQGLALLAASAPIRDMLLGARLSSPENVHLVRPGVHPRRSADCFTNPQYAPAIVAAGAFDALPPFAACLDAFAKLRAAGRECVFFLVGAGPAETPIRHLAHKLGLLSDLTFIEDTGHEQLVNILKSADIFVAPAATNELSLDVLTAMAAGVPVVTAPSPASDFIMDGRTAMAFPDGDAVALAQRLSALLDDIPAARALAENALEHLREHHSPARMVAEAAEIYRALGAPAAVGAR